MRPLTSRTLRGPGTRVTPPVAASAPQLEAAAPAAAPRRPLDVSNRYREERAAATRKNKRFGNIVLLSLGVLLIGAAVTLLTMYVIYQRGEAQHRREKAAYSEWLGQQQHEITVRMDAAARALLPIYADLPTGRSHPELTAQLTARYAPTLRTAGADYIWCRKSWKHGNQTMAVNLAAEPTDLFLALPAQAVQLAPEPLARTNLNGQAGQSGQLMIYWDAERGLPVAVATLMLAPERPAPAPGQPLPTPIPPTQFTLWYDLPPPTGDGRAYLDKLLTAAVDPAAATAETN